MPRKKHLRKAVILAGGIGSRMAPFTLVDSKHMAIVYDLPQILWAYEKVIDFTLGIVVGRYGGQIRQLFRKLGIGDISFINQGTSVSDNKRGIAHAIGLTESFADGDPILIHLGDQFLPEFDLKAHHDEFLRSKADIRLLLKMHRCANRHSVAFVDHGKVVDVREKPKTPEKAYVMTGVYCFRPRVYQLIKNLEPDPNTGRQEFSTVVRKALHKGFRVDYSVLDTFWADCGTPENIFQAAKYVRDKIRRVPEYGDD